MPTNSWGTADAAVRHDSRPPIPQPSALASGVDNPVVRRGAYLDGAASMIRTNGSVGELPQLRAVLEYALKDWYSLATHGITASGDCHCGQRPCPDQPGKHEGNRGLTKEHF